MKNVKGKQNWKNRLGNGRKTRTLSTYFYLLQKLIYLFFSFPFYSHFKDENKLVLITFLPGFQMPLLHLYFDKTIDFCRKEANENKTANHSPMQSLNSKKRITERDLLLAFTRPYDVESKCTFYFNRRLVFIIVSSKFSFSSFLFRFFWCCIFALLNCISYFLDGK